MDDQNKRQAERIARSAHGHAVTLRTALEHAMQAQKYDFESLLAHIEVVDGLCSKLKRLSDLINGR